MCKVAGIDTIVLKQTEEVAYRIDDRSHKAADTADLHKTITHTYETNATKHIAPKSYTATRTATASATSSALRRTST